MSNTLNLRLSNFVDSNAAAVEGRDFFINNKTLIVPLSSNWLRDVTEITAVNKGLILLDPSNAQQLRTLVVSETGVDLRYTGGTNVRTISAVGVTNQTITLTGRNIRAVSVVNSLQLRNLNLTSQTVPLTSFVAANNPSLSTLNLGLSTVNLATTRAVEINNNALTQTSSDTFFWQLCAALPLLPPPAVGGSFIFGDTNITPPPFTIINGLSGVGSWNSFNIASYQFGNYIFGQLG
jgi:hypothetical protein